MKTKNNSMNWDHPLNLSNENNQTQYVNLKNGDKLFIEIRNKHGSFPKHSHSFDELCIITRGCVVHYKNDIPSLAVAGDIIYVNAGEIHEFTNPHKLNLINVSFKYGSWVDSENSLYRLIKDLINFSRDKNLFSVSWPTLIEIKRLLENAIGFSNKYNSDMPYYEEYNQALLSQLFLTILMNDKYEQLPSPNTHVEGICLDLIRDFRKYDKNIDIKKFVLNRGVNYTTILKHFKSLIGLTPKQAYTNELLYTAKRYVITHNLTNLNQIDKYIKINDLDYFIRRYKEYFNINSYRSYNKK